MNGFVRRGWLTCDSEPELTEAGREGFGAFGLHIAGLEAGRRPVCRSCLDWSERRSHLGGALGAALLASIVTRGWAKRDAGRVISFTPAGRTALDAALA